jgi:hypothetical protein
MVGFAVALPTLQINAINLRATIKDCPYNKTLVFDKNIGWFAINLKANTNN